MQGGTYEATLLLGDTSCAAGLSWSLGQVHLPEDPQAAAAPKFLSAAFQPLSNTKPEIVHMFVSGRGGGEECAAGGHQGQEQEGNEGPHGCDVIG